MIQVCSVCGTRWNVRDKQRQWCPRCQGALLAPSAGEQVAAPASGWHRSPGAAAGPHPLPSGYRWIAVRPGAAPSQQRRRRPLGPTPRYDFIPRWGLFDHIEPASAESAPARSGPSARVIRLTLYTAAAVMIAAAVVHAIRYLLLIINRTTLLPRFVALPAVWLGVLFSVAVLFAVIGCAVVMTGWLIRRRAAVFAHLGHQDPRSAKALWAGCLIPVVNLVWAPVFVIETATAENTYQRMRKPILVWAVLWVLCTGVSVFAIATSFTTDAQGIADNTVTVTLAYLLSAATVATLARVYFGFERKPVERPAHRWVIVAADSGPSELRGKAEPQTAVEPGSQEPAA
ncbi:DUF4328 domain-containing protein [Mycolicibacterium mengxianglii]|uniref:DUF4328 domain-containing protein n=1 Tax=Mycolicibacterium mengxianglii TaxID=2736649 RepID=UPI0018D080BD|nr:DUF4328 domain-containing protein [Mycolicibacterium mengxianglii]